MLTLARLDLGLPEVPRRSWSTSESGLAVLLPLADPNVRLRALACSKDGIAAGKRFVSSHTTTATIRAIPHVFRTNRPNAFFGSSSQKEILICIC